MNLFLAFDSPIVIWGVIPVLIFLARIIDVSIGTIRIIYISKGMKYLAPVFGFFEVLVWLFAIGQIMNNITNILYYVVFALGFAAGNYVGIILEERLAVGKVVLRTITQGDASALIAYLRSRNYGVTVVNAEGARGPVKIIFTIIKRKDVPSVTDSIQQFNPRAFFSLEDVRLARDGVFPSSTPEYLPWRMWQFKGK